MNELEDLEKKIKIYIELLIKNPPEDESGEELDSEEILMPPSKLEQLAQPWDCDWYYEDWEDPYDVSNSVSPEEYFGFSYDEHRLGENSVDSQPLKFLPDDFDDLPDHAQWIVPLKKLPTLPLVELEPIEASPERLRYLLSLNLSNALSQLTQIIGTKTAKSVFCRTPNQFLNLLESCVLCGTIDNSLISVSLIVLGRPNVMRLFLRKKEQFFKCLLAYLEPLREVPGLGYYAVCWGPEFLQKYKRAATKDIRLDQYREIEHLMAPLLNAQLPLIKSFIRILGSDFVYQYLNQAQGPNIAKSLVELGNPIWEYILTDHIGSDQFKRLVSETPNELCARLETMYRINNSIAVLKLMGESEIRRLLQKSDQATLPLSAIGLLCELRPFLPDDPQILKSMHPGILELLSLGTRFDAVWKMIPEIARIENTSALIPSELNSRLWLYSFVRRYEETRETSQSSVTAEQWTNSAIRLLNLLRRLPDAGIYPRPELIMPILENPGRLEEELRRYRNIQEIFHEPETLTLHDLASLNESPAVLSAIAYGPVRKKIAGHLPFSLCRSVFSEALNQCKKGAVVPALPVFAQPIEMEIHEGMIRFRKNLDYKPILDLQTEILSLSMDVISYKHSWQELFDLCRAAGRPIDPRLQASVLRINLGRPSDQAVPDPFGIIFQTLLNQYSSAVSEVFVQLFTACHLRLAPDLLDRIKIGRTEEMIEALHEFFYERLPDSSSAHFFGLRDIAVKWLTESGHSQFHAAADRLMNAKRLGDLENAINRSCARGEEEKTIDQAVLKRFKKAFPTTSDSFLLMRNIVLREFSKIRRVTSNRLLKMSLRPSRSILNLFNFSCGEDCSSAPRHQPRIFHPDNVFYRILLEGSDVARGYLSVLIVRRGAEIALKFDVINPSNQLKIDAQDFLNQLVKAFGDQARNAGAVYIGFPEDWKLISNRGFIVNAARALYENCPIEQGFSLNPPTQCFQSPAGGLRIVYSAR